MENANISTSVDVKLGHDDIVEIMIEEQKEKKEAQIFEISEKIGSVSEKYNTILEKLEQSIIKSNGIKNTSAYKRFTKGVAALGISSEESIHVRFNQEVIGTFDFIRLEAIENHKNPITSLKREISKQKTGSSCNSGSKSHNTHKPSEILVDLRATSSDGQVTLVVKFPKIVDLKINATAKKQIEELRIIASEWFKLDKEKYDLEKELFIIEHDGVRNRAKFVKGMLNNSESGKELVMLMENIQKNNFLQIGTKK